MKLKSVAIFVMMASLFSLRGRYVMVIIRVWTIQTKIMKYASSMVSSKPIRIIELNKFKFKATDLVFHTGRIWHLRCNC